MESMIAMGGYSLPTRTVREIIAGSVDVIVQAARLRDGSRRITHISEVVGMEGDVIITQDLMTFDMDGEDANGRIIGASPLVRHRSSAFLGPALATSMRKCGSPRRWTAWNSRPPDGRA